MIGTYGPCAEFIKLAHKAGFHPTFVNVSFVGANALARELGAAGEAVSRPVCINHPADLHAFAIRASFYRLDIFDYLRRRQSEGSAAETFRGGNSREYHHGDAIRFARGAPER